MAAGAAGPGDEREGGAPGARRLPTQPTQPTNRVNPALQPTFVMILPRCRLSGRIIAGRPANSQSRGNMPFM